MHAFIGVLVLLSLLTAPSGAPLRNLETGAIIGDSPLMNSLIVLIMLVFLATGFAYGRAAGVMKTLPDAIAAITKTFSGPGGLLFLFLVIAQFLAYFNYSNIATLWR